MLYVVDRLQTLDEHIVDIDLHYFVDLVGKYFVDEALVGFSHIIEAKGHDPIAIQTSIYHEGGVLLVRLMHLDLVVSRICIHEA